MTKHALSPTVDAAHSSKTVSALTAAVTLKFSIYALSGLVILHLALTEAIKTLRRLKGLLLFHNSEFDMTRESLKTSFKSQNVLKGA